MQDRFHKALRLKLVSLKLSRTEALLSGGTRADLTAEVLGLHYWGECNYMQALDDVLTLCEDIEKEWDQ